MRTIGLGFLSNLDYRPAQAGYAGKDEKSSWLTGYFQFDGNRCTLKAFGRLADRLQAVFAALAEQNFGTDGSGNRNKPSIAVYVEGEMRFDESMKDGEKRTFRNLVAQKVTPVIMGSAAVQLASQAQQIYVANRARRTEGSGMDDSGSWARPATSQAPAQPAAPQQPVPHTPRAGYGGYPSGMAGASTQGLQSVDGVTYGGPWSTAGPQGGDPKLPPF